MRHSEIANAAHQEHFNCSQSVLLAYAPELGLERDLALRVATGFGGGMGRLAATCGAVTGAFMVLGLKYGMVDAANQDAKEKTYALVQEFARQFKARCGALDCRDLLGCDLSAPGGLQIAREKQLFDTRCPLLIQAATEILDQLLETA
jgi:C_GCAxxG_C_C family probable redox protein